MTTAQQPAPAKVPLLKRINFRLIVFIFVVGAPLLWALYVFVASEITHGIRDAGGGYKLVDLKAISSFSFDQVNGRIEDVPQRFRDLDGQKVILFGEIAPATFSASNLHGFELVYSRQNCCFPGPPQIQHFVQSRVKSGEEIRYYTTQIKVKGTLHVDVKRRPEGDVASVYELDVEEVEPVM